MAKATIHKTYVAASVLTGFVLIAIFSFKNPTTLSVNERYKDFYKSEINKLTKVEKELYQLIQQQDVNSETGKNNIHRKLLQARLQMKGTDFWLRYLDQTAYHSVNGPLPVEWETEVFEKFERPYKREGAGFTLTELYLAEKNIRKDSLLSLVNKAVNINAVYLADSTSNNLNSFHHFFLANRLYLLNLAAVYTTGFECPDDESVIPELDSMMRSVSKIYEMYNQSFPDHALNNNYTTLYNLAAAFVRSQPHNRDKFDHYEFIRLYVNPLFSLNQQMIREYKVVSNNLIDFSLDENCNSIFDKTLFKGQNEKGIFLPVDDEATLEEIRAVGKKLFYDPILSGNLKRSCASCHKSSEYFTDTSRATSLQFNNKGNLPRNTISLINVLYNHLVMVDGRHTSLLNQARDVVSNPVEMGGTEADIVKNVFSCNEYKKAFTHFAKLTPGQNKPGLDHIVSAVILYYSSFSNYYAPFDNAMNKGAAITAAATSGFNIFMGKAQCGTCHFVPQFNGVKPPYINTEFEVLGVPSDISFTKLSIDSGRALVNPTPEMLHAFRTSTIRNAAFTKPYMHNGIFKTLDEVIDFYDAGGGSGKGLKVENQTLPGDSLKLTKQEKSNLLGFINSLNEEISFDAPPESLPPSSKKELNKRKVTGDY